jgi:thiamine biosynthesis protein ThiS
MQVMVNGRPMEIRPGSTVQALLDEVELEPSRVAVERNQDIVPRRSYAACELVEGDRIEIVTFVGGG